MRNRIFSFTGLSCLIEIYASGRVSTDQCAFRRVRQLQASGELSVIRTVVIYLNETPF